MPTVLDAVTPRQHEDDGAFNEVMRPRSLRATELHEPPSAERYLHVYTEVDAAAARVLDTLPKPSDATETIRRNSNPDSGIPADSDRYGKLLFCEAFRRTGSRSSPPNSARFPRVRDKMWLTKWPRLWQ